MCILQVIIVVSLQRTKNKHCDITLYGNVNGMYFKCNFCKTNLQTLTLGRYNSIHKKMISTQFSCFSITQSGKMAYKHITLTTIKA